MYITTALTSAVLLCLSVHVHAEVVPSDDHKSTCTTFNESILTRVVDATTLEAQINLTARIIADILPGFSISGRDISDHSVRDSILREVYTNVSKHYERRVTEGGYRQFLEATNEISVAKEEACRNASRITSQSLKVIQEFVDVYKMNESTHSIRSVYGKLLCLNSTLNTNSSKASRKRRASEGDECKCPPRGFDSNFTSCDFCDFYACLTDDLFEEIFFKSHFNVDYQCLAFIIDTTASMTMEINTAKDVILNFVRSEQDIGSYGDGCYMLVEFNDVGPNDQIVPEDSVSDVTYAISNDALHLSNFYERVTDIRAGWINGRVSFGGDGPEYALYAMKKALKAKDDDGFTLLATGSQMIVLTDASSKQPELKENVTRYASGQEVCIHFFVNDPEYSLTDGIYQAIAEGTHGTLISSFNQWDIANFVAKYEENGGCEYLSRRKKRSAPLFCKTVTVSRLAANLRLSINAPTGSGITITQPNGVDRPLVVAQNDFILFNQTNPVHGPWKVCSTDGHSIQVTDVITYRIDTTVLYWNSDITSVIPPACTTGRIVIITSEFSSIRSASLDFVQARSKNSTITVRVNLTKGCEGALVSDVLTFPNGSYTYRMIGTDIDGVPFKYNSKRVVTFRQPDDIGEFSFEPVTSLALEMDRDEIVTLDYNFTNRGTYNKTFNFSVNASEGLATRIDPSSLLVAAGATVKLQVLLRVTHSSIKRGTLHTVNVTATISCTGQQIQAPTRSVFITTEAPTPADECGGCQNGGTCIVRVRRGRVIRRCSCPHDFGGTYCQVAY